uniref:Uncharacterized protein n=1 Tax=Vespula pensylvanica TaxID=30213 RepID=A0A834N7U4_VESPE|nr:hypothetical protein H0235_016097 [Vespula pensylvanica]
MLPGYYHESFGNKWPPRPSTSTLSIKQKMLEHDARKHRGTIYCYSLLLNEVATRDLSEKRCWVSLSRKEEEEEEEEEVEEERRGGGEAEEKKEEKLKKEEEEKEEEEEEKEEEEEEEEGEEKSGLAVHKRKSAFAIA